MNIILLVIPTLVIILYEAPPLMRKRLWKELALFGILLCLGFSLALLQILGVPLPSLTDGIALITRKLIGLFGVEKI